MADRLRWRPWPRGIRWRLLALVLAPLLLLTTTVIVLAASWSSRMWSEQLLAKVNADLHVAGDLFERTQFDRARELATLAESGRFQDALATGDVAAVSRMLSSQRGLGGFDFLNLLNPDGTRRLTSAGWQPWPIRRSPLTRRVLAGALDGPRTDAALGIEIYAPDAWRREAVGLAERVVLPLVDTPRATPTTADRETRAMVVRVLQRVRTTKGASVGLLEGGMVLNRDERLVDDIRDLVYGPGSLTEGSRGTVTVFLEDVRISTNVPGPDGSRALGTRVSREVRDAVLGEGRVWRDRAFVVDDWYISAYQPIVDVRGRRVGMLYAGYLEAPFRRAMQHAIVALALVLLAGTFFAAVAAARGARTIYRPIERLAGIAHEVARSGSNATRRRSGQPVRDDEIGALARQFDHMLDTLDTQRRRIERDAEVLERKVSDRTRELRRQNRQLLASIELLQATRRQLADAEKFAALGEVAAGVAHEINNPTAVILGSLDVIAERLGRDAEPLHDDIELAIEQVYRIRSITDRLLQYARHSPLPESLPDSSALVTIDLDTTVDESLQLVRHEVVRRSADLVCQGRSGATVAIERDALHQVMVNLLVNAVEAIDVEGHITVTIGRGVNGDVRVSVADDGHGIDPAHRSRLFDPFFTFGKPHGTGLGLSVSYGIVTSAGGTIEVASEPGLGTTFTIVLPVAPTSVDKETVDNETVDRETVDREVVPIRTNDALIVTERV